MNCPFSSIVCLQAGLDRDAPPRTLQKMSQKSDGFAWNFCELYVIEKTQNAFGEFRAANVSSFARPLMTVGRPIQTHGPYPGREPTHPLVAGPGFGPARHLGDRARPTRHHPDPPAPFAHGTLPAMRPTLRPRPQPLRTDPGRPALGRPRRPDPAAGAPPVLRQRRL